ncbi:hypothetical protein ACHAWF_015229, partial [Thalassiosira exigua]
RGRLVSLGIGIGIGIGIGGGLRGEVGRRLRYASPSIGRPIASSSPSRRPLPGRRTARYSPLIHSAFRHHIMGCASSKSSSSGGGRGGLTETERVMGGRRGIDKSERHMSSAKSASERTKAREVADSVKRSGKKPRDALLPPPKVNANGQLVAEEVAKRISGSVEGREVVLGDDADGGDDDCATTSPTIRISYAALTQRGYYPDDPHKENQDAYHVTSTNFASGTSDAFFAVFDGHGDDGHACARYCQKTLPRSVSQQVKKARAAENAKRLRELERRGESKPKNAFHPKNWPELEGDAYEECCREAHARCNQALREDKHVKDSLSGTTAISVGFHAGRMTISNVGDSRAVLGYRMSDANLDLGSTPAEEEKKEIGDDGDSVQTDDRGTSSSAAPSHKPGDLVAVPLSEDQTPYRKDERERLKRAGARIMSIDQMEGLVPMHDDWGEVDLGVDIDTEGDPPRVWTQDHNYPGEDAFGPCCLCRLPFANKVPNGRR